MVAAVTSLVRASRDHRSVIDTDGIGNLVSGRDAATAPATSQIAPG
jgi:hypothetical protein